MSEAPSPDKGDRKRRRRPAPPTAASDVFLGAVPDMMFRMNGDGYYLGFKPAKGLEPYVPPEAFLGKNVLEVMPSDLAERTLHHIRRAIATGQVETFEYELSMDEGVHRYEARIVRLGQDDVLAIVRDLTIHGPTSGQEVDGLEEATRRYGLSERELAVLRLVAVGITDKEIAERLEISTLTASHHVANIRHKMGAGSRTEAGVRAVKERLIA